MKPLASASRPDEAAGDPSQTLEDEGDSGSEASPVVTEHESSEEEENSQECYSRTGILESS